MLNPDKTIYVDLAQMASFKRRDAIDEFKRDHSRMPKVIVYNRKTGKYLMGPVKAEK